MSVIDKVIAAVTPPESDEARAQARQKAEAAATSCRWLALVLGHHRQIEDAFAAARSATDVSSRLQAQKRLGLVLTGHANAEESVLYPALALHGEKMHAGAGYSEQQMVKIQMAALEDLDPLSQDWQDKLEHIRGAVAHHMYEEEGNWFLDLAKKPEAMQSKLTERFSEEFERYAGSAA